MKLRVVGISSLLLALWGCSSSVASDSQGEGEGEASEGEGEASEGEGEASEGEGEASEGEGEGEGEAGEGEGEGEEEVVPGGDISAHISDPSLVQGYTDTVPSGVTGTCSTDQYWQFRDRESSRMHPGRACLECHISEGEGPRRGFLGTVQQNVTDSNDCRGVGDTLVEILDDVDGSVMASTTTNNAGNFIIESALCSGADCPPYRVRLTLDGRTREMFTAQTNGDCMACHTAVGVDGAPGRIVAP
jgi:hypothetical protein